MTVFLCLDLQISILKQSYRIANASVMRRAWSVNRFFHAAARL